jgi:hypothetical protein
MPTNDRQLRKLKKAIRKARQKCHGEEEVRRLRAGLDGYKLQKQRQLLGTVGTMAPVAPMAPMEPMAPLELVEPVAPVDPMLTALGLTATEDTWAAVGMSPDNAMRCVIDHMSAADFVGIMAEFTRRKPPARKCTALSALPDIQLPCPLQCTPDQQAALARVTELESAPGFLTGGYRQNSHDYSGLPPIWRDAHELYRNRSMHKY